LFNSAHLAGNYTSLTSLKIMNPAITCTKSFTKMLPHYIALKLPTTSKQVFSSVMIK